MDDNTAPAEQQARRTTDYAGPRTRTTIADRQWECGTGWTDLLLRLDADLTRLDPAYGVAQVKEKFGGLRVYLQAEYPERRALYEVCWAYGAVSEYVCETCGAPGYPRRRGGWFFTACDADALDCPPLAPNADDDDAVDDDRDPTTEELERARSEAYADLEAVRVRVGLSG